MASQSVRNNAMTPLALYARYRIYRGLQMHQLRVAAVARALAQASREPVDADLVTRVGLFHDMGNIIKADLPRFQEFLEPEGLTFWETVKQDFIAQYGTDEHAATAAICRDIGLSETERELIANMRFSRTQWILEEGSLAQKICKYADMRVSPWGIVPMRERLAEARERYAGAPMDSGEAYTSEVLTRSAALCDEIERVLFASLPFSPESITDASTANLVEELKQYRIS